MSASSSILNAIGRTPLVRLEAPSLPTRVVLWGKCEWHNPGSSVKDRTALSLVTEGERSGALRRGKSTGRYLRERNPVIRICAVEPDEPLHGLEGLKHMASAIVPEIYDTRGRDEVLTVATEDAYARRRAIRAEQGLVVGHSAAAAIVAALQLARGLDDAGIVVLLPDQGEPDTETHK